MFQVADEHTYEDGQIIWEEGSHGDWIYLVQTGKVELSRKVRGEKVIIDILQSDDIFGESEYILKEPRIFTAKAIGTTILGIIDRDFLDQEYNRLSDDFKIIMRNLALRLNKTTENINCGRKSPRSLKVLSLVFKTKESLINAFTANASTDGLLIKTPKPLPKGEVFSLKLQLPDDPEPLQIECEVVWNRVQTPDPIRLPVGMGVKFIQISNADKIRLEEELRRLPRR